MGVGYLDYKNPDHPHLEIKLGGSIYDIPKNFLSQFSCQRHSDEIGFFSFTIEDAYELGLENKLKSLIVDQGTISFRYGWTKGGMSSWYFGYINTYTPSFRANMHMSFTVQGVLDATKRMSHSVAYKGSSISEIARQCIEMEGWQIGQVDESDPLTEEITIIQGNVPTLDFIREKLEPEATCGGQPMVFYLDTCDVDGPPKAYFVAVGKSAVVQKTYNFFVNAGNYGNVLSFDPEINGAYTSIMTEAGIIDEATNEVSVYGSRTNSSDPEVELTIYGSSSPDRMKALLQNKWFGVNAVILKAKLCVIGDPSLRPLQKINVIPILPNGDIHYSGGTYTVWDVLDEINMGQFTSTMNIMSLDERMDLNDKVYLIGKD